MPPKKKGDGDTATVTRRRTTVPVVAVAAEAVKLCTICVKAPAEPGFDHCNPCHRDVWLPAELIKEDRRTRPLRQKVSARLASALPALGRKYFRGNWPEEVRTSYEAAVRNFQEGDAKAQEAMAEGNPKPHLFPVARAHYFLCEEGLDAAFYHGNRISVKAALKDLTGDSRRKVEGLVKKAADRFAQVPKLEGRDRTRASEEAEHWMHDALTAAHKARDEQFRGSAKSFYSGAPAATLADCPGAEKLAALRDAGTLDSAVPDRSDKPGAQKAAPKRRTQRNKEDE